MASEQKTLSVQDSFLDVLLSDIVAGTEKLSSWINQIQGCGGIEKLFELETWLRSLGAFFDVRHLPFSESEREDVVIRDFSPELRIVRRVLQICERDTLEVLKLGQADRMEFETFIENQMRKDSVLDYHVSKILEQPTPSDSLQRLLETMTDLMVLLGALRERPHPDLQVYIGIGRMFQRGIRECRYVDMLLTQRFRLQYDRVDNPVLSGMLRGIKDYETRRCVAMILLYLHRFLRYLKVVSFDLTSDRPLRHTLAIFSLLHQEAGYFVDFVKSKLVKGHRMRQALRNAGELMVHSARHDTKRVLDRELVFASADGDPSTIYTKIENSHGVLRNCFQSCILTLAQACDQTIEGRSLFPHMVEGFHKSQQLRQALWQLRQDFRDVLEGRVQFDLGLLMERMAQFRETSLKYLMYRDWGEFERFSDSLITSTSSAEVRNHLRTFVIYLDLLVAEVSKRNVLKQDIGEAATNPETAPIG